MHVTAADFVRKFARYRDDAKSGPVYVTHHGRETHVLCDIQTFRSMQHDDQIGSEALNPNTLFGLADWIDEGIIACDENLIITFANRLAHSLVNTAPGSLVGRPIDIAMPKIKGSVIDIQARETQRHGDSNSADLPSPFNDNAWLRFQSFRLNNHLVLRLRDITTEAEHYLKANVKEAIIDAMDAHGDIFYVRVSQRDTIDRVDAPFCRLMGMSAERLNGLMLSDLVLSSDKTRYRDALETVLRGGSSQRLQLKLLTNTGDAAPVCLSMVALNGTYGTEGAVIVFTRMDYLPPEEG